MTLYSYIIAKDYGLAPNPFWGKMTLAVCKPGIRKHATEGDWIIGTGVKNLSRANKAYVDFGGKLVFAMKVSDVVSMKEYDRICTASTTDLKNKIPTQDSDWRRMVGDCIYKYPLNGEIPMMRPGLHCSDDIERDLSGENVLMSDHFYYFGENAIQIDCRFKELLKHKQGHLKFENENLTNDFVVWLTGFGYERNSINGYPQLLNEISMAFETEPFINGEQKFTESAKTLY